MKGLAPLACLCLLSSAVYAYEPELSLIHI